MSVMHICMNWGGVDFDWNHARALLVTAEEGSLSAAARVLGQTQSTLGRQVSALEEELGVTLFERVGNRLSLTETGLDLCEQVRLMNAAATQLALVATGRSQTLEGLVRIAASEVMACYFLPDILKELHEEFPQIEFEIVVSNQPSDLMSREADIAIRHAPLSGDDLIARLIAKESRAYLYATPTYLQSIQCPQTQQELAERAQMIGFDSSDRFRQALIHAGFPVPPGNLSLRSPSQLTGWQLARAGLGCAMMMQQVGDADACMRRALPEADPGFAFSTWLVCHRELRTSRRCRVVFERLIPYLTRVLR